MAITVKRRRSMKKVKKMRGGGDCDKGNTNLISRSNAISEETFIGDMNDPAKRTRFLQLVANEDGYTGECLNKFKDKIEEKIANLRKELDFANSEIKKDATQKGFYETYKLSRNAELGSLDELESAINVRLGERDFVSTVENPFLTKRKGGNSRKHNRRGSKQ